MTNRYAKAARAAAKLTNKQLGDELAKLGPASSDALRELLPTKRDKREFAKLMAVVEAEAELDEQVAYLAENVQTAGRAALKALKFFA